MIYFNATFFVQILNFLLAWWLLRKFLFRPLVSAIQHERAANTRLNNTVATEKELLEKACKEQNRQWSWYQQQFKKRIPESVIHAVISARSFKKIEPPHISSTEKSNDCVLLTDLVVSRLSHD